MTSTNRDKNKLIEVATQFDLPRLAECTDTSEVIVGTFFKCDDDTETARKQHDVYGEALGAIIRTNNRLALFAKSLLDDKSHPNWGTIETCDHRTLKGAHDLLAAASRSRHDFRQSELPLERVPERLVPHMPENLWLWWLRDEIENGCGTRNLCATFN